ncbi:MAG: ATP-binding protein [Candidatus Korobacteraceae bacterium]
MSADDKLNILMVDDQPAKLLSYEAILGELGENLVKAASGTEALEYLLENDVAVVLMDVSMPDMDGFEIAEIIRQHPRFQRTAIIFVSAVHLTEMDRLKGYQRGAVDYISVPVVPEVLRAKVSVFAELHRKTRQLEILNRELEQRVLERTEELHKSESMLRERAHLLDLASEAIMVRDLNGALLFWNSGAEALYGWKRDEVLGLGLHQLLQTQFPVSQAAIQAALTETGRWEGNLVQRARDGRELVIACRKAVNLQSSGTDNVVLEINRDITAQLQAEEALRKSERMAAIGQFAGTMAHEINNPLEAITNIFYLLRDHPSLDAEAREYARLADEELLRIGRITRQTLSFYRESQRPTSLALSQVLDDVLGLQASRVRMNGISVQKDYATAGEIDGFPGELRQVFLNITANAIQAMPEGGQLRIRLCESADRRTGRAGIRVSISDTGAGIQPESAKHLFEPFFTTKSTKGTGLGLWISKGIIEKYEGSIRFRSLNAYGRYTTCFSIFLPTLASNQAEVHYKEAVRSV